MRDSELFASRAEAAMAEAQGAVLDNVRDRALRSEKAWSEMAERSRKMEASRDARDRPAGGSDPIAAPVA